MYKIQQNNYPRQKNIDKPHLLPALLRNQEGPLSFLKGHRGDAEETGDTAVPG